MNNFKQKFLNISKTQKTRMITAFCICIILNVSTILYVSEISNYQPVVKSVDNIYVDGSNFTSFVNWVVDGFNGFMYLLMCAMSAVAIFVLGIIMLTPFLFVALRKTAIIHDIELQYAKNLILVMAFFTFVICLIVSQFSLILIDIILVSLPMLLMLLFYYLPLKLRIKNSLK